MGLWAKNTLLRVNRGRTGWVSTVTAIPERAAAVSPVLVAGGMGALVSLTPPAVAAAAAAVPAFALRIYAASGVRIRQHRHPGTQVGDLFITQGQQAGV